MCFHFAPGKYTYTSLSFSTIASFSFHSHHTPRKSSSDENGTLWGNNSFSNGRPRCRGQLGTSDNADQTWLPYQTRNIMQSAAANITHELRMVWNNNQNSRNICCGCCGKGEILENYSVYNFKYVSTSFWKGKNKKGWIYITMEMAFLVIVLFLWQEYFHWKDQSFTGRTELKLNKCHYYW